MSEKSTEKSKSTPESVTATEGSTARTEAPPPKVLPADVYDTLEFASLAFGGIRAGPLFKTTNAGQRSLYSWGQDLNCPICAHGLALASTADGDGDDGYFLGDNEVSKALDNAGVDGVLSDRVVRVINRRKLRKNLSRSVTWREYTRELNIVRGE